MDGLLAYLGLLEDAAPRFRSAQAGPHAGVLLAVAALIQTGIFECTHDIFGTLGGDPWGQPGMALR